MSDVRRLMPHLLGKCTAKIDDTATSSQWAAAAFEGQVDGIALARLVGLSTELVALRDRMYRLPEALEGSGYTPYPGGGPPERSAPSTTATL